MNTNPANGGFMFLTHADTDLLTMSKLTARLPPDFPAIFTANPAYLNDSEIDRLLEEQLPTVAVVILRLLGGKASFKYGIEKLQEWAHTEHKWLICLSGTDTPEPELTALSNTALELIHTITTYLQLGGIDNFQHGLRFLSDQLLASHFSYSPPVSEPQHGLYYPGLPAGLTREQLQAARHNPTRPTIGLLFYRSHYLSDNLDFVDAIVQEAEVQGLNLIPVYTYSLKETNLEEALPEALRYFVDGAGKPIVEAVVTTTSYAMGGINPDGATLSGWSVAALERLGVPMLQAIAVGSSRKQWEASLRGLSPLETAANVALPEFDGRIITVPISFKEMVRGANDNRVAVPKYVPDRERIGRVLGLAKRWAVLRRKPNAAKRVAFVLTNAPGKAARIGNAVGLDAPASLLQLLRTMREKGYTIEDVPDNSDKIIHDLIARCSYDEQYLSEQQLAQAVGQVPIELYQQWFADLPAQNQAELCARWGEPPGQAYVHGGQIALAGLQYGNALIALQPPRGYGMNPDAIYHTPDLPPTHHYYALYRWLQEPVERGGWGADAIVHVGKHGTLEWLPGKGVGLSQTCYPDLFLGNLPLIYPFIINDPGEGAQAKRRGHAVIVDHMTPPMMQAENYGALAELAQLVDEYYQVELLDPPKLPQLRQQIWQLIQQAKLTSDLSFAPQTALPRQFVPTGEPNPALWSGGKKKAGGEFVAVSSAKLKSGLNLMVSQNHGDHTHDLTGELNEDGTPVSFDAMGGKDFAHLVETVNGYLCELAGAQIRNGLHSLGDVPRGERLTALLFSLVRLPNLEIPSLRAALAQAWGLDLAELLANPGGFYEQAADMKQPELKLKTASKRLQNSKLLTNIDQTCHTLLDNLQKEGFAVAAITKLIGNLQESSPLWAKTPQPLQKEGWEQVFKVLEFICQQLMPNLEQNQAEIENILGALEGKYIPAGPSGAPTRGMAHVLPTGRNFYAVDPRSLPSMAAWRVGEQLANQLLERHLAETNTYPESVGLSIWGTSAMRTSGDDVAQVLALLGVKPRWQPENRRLLGVEVISLEELGRPRIDVVCRISGFFRDAFPHLINLLDEAVQKVAKLSEPLEQNFVRKHYLKNKLRLELNGIEAKAAEKQALYRVFGNKPGAYGAGILALIDAGNWQNVNDLAEVYLNWGGYAYTAGEYGAEAKEAFKEALSGVAVAAKNQDNREHDIFDSDDYLQYHGGMIAAIRTLSGLSPKRYFGDSSDPSRPVTRDLGEEALRVFRTRVINPKWLDSIQQHGYKGGLELNATLDYLFGYDATAEIMEDWMYEQLAKAYLLDSTMRQFLERSNPWALREMAGRLLEATKRGLWKNPPPEMVEALYAISQDIEDVLEWRDNKPNP